MSEISTIQELSARLDAISAPLQKLMRLHNIPLFDKNASNAECATPVDFVVQAQEKHGQDAGTKAPDAGDDATIDALYQVIYALGDWSDDDAKECALTAARCILRDICSGNVPGVCLTIHKPGKAYEDEIAKLRSQVENQDRIIAGLRNDMKDLLDQLDGM